MKITDLASNLAAEIMGLDVLRHELNEQQSDEVHGSIQELLSKALSAGGAGAVVKPLEWIDAGGGRSKAVTEVGDYEAEWDESFFEVVLNTWATLPGFEVSECVDDDGASGAEKRAKAAAQADYEARILSALAAPAQEAGAEPVGHRWRYKNSITNDWSGWIPGRRPEKPNPEDVIEEQALFASPTPIQAVDWEKAAKMASSVYRDKRAEYDRDFRSDDMNGEKWRAKYGTNLHSTALGDEWAMRHALRAASPTPESGHDAPVADSLNLDPVHIRLLRRGAKSKWIGLSDDAGTRVGEVCALGELSRAGLVKHTEDELPPGPPSPRPMEITEEGRAALRALAKEDRQ